MVTARPLAEAAADPSLFESSLSRSIELGSVPLVAVALVAWFATGALAARVLATRGHDLRVVLGLAVVLGPLFVPLALDHVRRRDPETPLLVLDGELPTEGPRTVVLLSGAPERAADALGVLRRFQDVPNLVLATTVGYSTLRAPESDDDRRAGIARLRDASVLLHEHQPTLVLAPGTLSHAIDRLVRPDHGDLAVLVGGGDASVQRGLARGSLSDVVVVPPVRSA